MKGLWDPGYRLYFTVSVQCKQCICYYFFFICQKALWRFRFKLPFRKFNYIFARVFSLKGWVYICWKFPSTFTSNSLCVKGNKEAGLQKELWNKTWKSRVKLPQSTENFQRETWAYVICVYKNCPIRHWKMYHSPTWLESKNWQMAHF